MDVVGKSSAIFHVESQEMNAIASASPPPSSHPSPLLPLLLLLMLPLSLQLLQLLQLLRIEGDAAADDDELDEVVDADVEVFLAFDLQRHVAHAHRKALTPRNTPSAGEKKVVKN